MVPVADRIATLRADAVRNVNEKQQAYEGKMATTENSLEMTMPVGISTAKAQLINAEHQIIKTEAQTQLTMGSDEMAFERGILLIAREVYRQDNDDRNYALRNAFLFGIGYRSGEDLQDKLRTKASDDESLRGMLIRIGRQARDVSDDDWKRLITQTRY